MKLQELVVRSEGPKELEALVVSTNKGRNVPGKSVGGVGSVART